MKKLLALNRLVLFLLRRFLLLLGGILLLLRLVLLGLLLFLLVVLLLILLLLVLLLLLLLFLFLIFLQQPSHPIEQWISRIMFQTGKNLSLGFLFLIPDIELRATMEVVLQIGR